MVSNKSIATKDGFVKKFPDKMEDPIRKLNKLPKELPIQTNMPSKGGGVRLKDNNFLYSFETENNLQDPHSK